MKISQTVTSSADLKMVFEVMAEHMSPPEPKRKQTGFATKETWAKYATKTQKRRTA